MNTINVLKPIYAIKIIKLKEPLSPHLKISLPFDFNFYLIKPYERNDYFKSTLSGEARYF